MNTRTKQDLIAFIEAVEMLTSGVLLHIGMQTATDIMNRCNELKVSLVKDETVTEEVAQ